jgi:hypothetical protein
VTEVELEQAIARLEKEQRTWSARLERASGELASLQGIGGWWSRITGGYAEQAELLEKQLAAAKSQLERIRPELATKREALAGIRRAAADARRAAEQTPIVQGDLPPPEGLSDEAQVVRLEVVTLRDARRAAHELSKAVAHAIERAQTATLAQHSVINRVVVPRMVPGVRFGPSMVEAFHHMRLKVADQGVRDAMETLERALELADVKGWMADGDDRSEDTFGLLKDVLLMTGALFNRSLLAPEERRDELYDLSGLIALLEDHLERRVAEGRQRLSDVRGG